MPSRAHVSQGRQIRLLRQVGEVALRGAARGWEDEYTAKMKGVDFVRGVYAPRVFTHPSRDLRCAVYGDGFTSAGAAADLEWAASDMGGWCEIKVKRYVGARGRGPGRHGDSQPEGA